eukprot:2882480-Pyramimonas_sp.AAC.1
MQTGPAAPRSSWTPPRLPDPPSRMRSVGGRADCRDRPVPEAEMGRRDLLWIWAAGARAGEG